MSTKSVETIEILMKKKLKEDLEKKISKTKYYYLTFDFFQKDLSMDFKYFNLKKEKIDTINTKGKEYFRDNVFKLTKVGHRILLKLDRKNRLKDKEKSIDNCIKEYVLWDLLEKGVSKKTQEINFLITYIEHLFEFNETNELLVDEFILGTEKVKFYIEKLTSEITEDKNVHIDTSEKIKKIKKIKNLYINKKYKDQLLFLLDYENFLNKIIEKKTTSEEDIQTFYRGQANASRDISPSISRNSNLKREEDELFFEILSLKPNEFDNDKSVYEKLITMQHFGLPTRLVDLSRNPLIGLYFACEKHFEKDGVLYVLEESRKNILNFSNTKLECLSNLVTVSYEDVEKLCNNCKNKEEIECSRPKEIMEKNYFVKGVAKNPRIDSQSGDFIFCGIDVENKSKCVDNLSELPKKILIIDKQIKEKILNDLKLLNIHGGSVYPDLSNMASHLKNELEKRSIKPNLKSTIKKADPFDEYKKEIQNFYDDVMGINKIDMYVESNDLEEFKAVISKELMKKLILQKEMNPKFFKIAIENLSQRKILFDRVSNKIYKEIKEGK